MWKKNKASVVLVIALLIEHMWGDLRLRGWDITKKSCVSGGDWHEQRCRCEIDPDAFKQIMVVKLWVLGWGWGLGILPGAFSQAPLFTSTHPVALRLKNEWGSWYWVVLFWAFGVLGPPIGSYLQRFKGPGEEGRLVWNICNSGVLLIQEYLEF